MTQLAITIDDVLQAQRRIAGAAHVTPVMRSRTADANTGAQLYFKCENLQRAGAFKFRGAFNSLSQFSAEQKRRGVVSFSSGNHAQAVALSAQLLGMSAVIVMPSDAPTIKMVATRGYGAEVILYDRYNEDREAIGQRLENERGLTLIPPFDHPHVMAGQGTAAQELFEQSGAMDVLVVPLGGGGFLSGCAVAAHASQPNATIVGVEPAAGNDGQQSFRSGSVVRIATPETIADGAQTNALGTHTFPVIRQLVDDIVTVTDAELVDTMKFFAERMKLLVEPTGCLAAAAVLSGKIAVAGKRVGIMLSGGNVDLQRFATLVSA
ncbi:MAG: threo-3-hydroxy-L-aspartate ammonia-lyase [Steroidobacteraceae bacterium]